MYLILFFNFSILTRELSLNCSLFNRSILKSLDRYTLGEITRFINIESSEVSDIIGEKL